MDLAKLLQDAVKSDGRTRYRIAKDAGVPYSAVHRLESGQRAVRLDYAGRLMDVLGLSVVKSKRKAAGNGK